MSTNTATIQSYRKIKLGLRKESPALLVKDFVAPVISISEKIDNYTPRQTWAMTAEPSGLNMPPLVRAYFKGRDNDPL